MVGFALLVVVWESKVKGVSLFDFRVCASKDGVSELFCFSVLPPDEFHSSFDCDISDMSDMFCPDDEAALVFVKPLSVCCSVVFFGIWVITGVGILFLFSGERF